MISDILPSEPPGKLADIKAIILFTCILYPLIFLTSLIRIKFHLIFWLFQKDNPNSLSPSP